MIRPALLAFALWLAPAVAAAQSDGDAKVTANALFDEGKRLIAAGDFARACPKFEASLKLFDQLGVRLNLADCYEQQGKTASAWTEFREAASRAARRDDERAVYAGQRADALAPRLMKLRISVPAASQLPGLMVRRDGIALPAAALGSQLPVNPGRITVEAAASGYRTWLTVIELSKPGAIITVEIPPLVADSSSAAPTASASDDDGISTSTSATPPAPQRFDRTAQRGRRRLALGVGSGGLVAIGAGVGLGLAARSKWGSVSASCKDDELCTAEEADTNRQARLYGNLGTVIGGVGVAALVTGAVLYLTAPAARPLLEHAQLSVTPAGDGRSAVRLGFTTRF